MAKDSNEDVSPSAKAKPKKARRKLYESSETAQKTEPLSKEIISDSDDNSEAANANPHENAGDEGAQSQKTQKNEVTDPTPPSAKDDSEGSSSAKGEDDQIVPSQPAADQQSRQSNHQKEAGSQNDDRNKSQQGVKRKVPHQDQESTSNRAPRFQPPKGFEPVKPPKISSTPSLRPLSPSNLQGKQLWHITAPAKVPMSAIHEIAFDKAMNGQPVLNHKGTSYGVRLSNEPEFKDVRLLVPSERGDSLKAVQSSMAETVHIHQLLEVADTSFTPKMELKGTGAASCMRLPRSKPPPKQRKGLKMGYMPSAVAGTSCTIGSSDSEVEEGEAQPNRTDSSQSMQTQVRDRQPKSPEFKKPEKRKREGGNATQQKTKKKTKREDERGKSDGTSKEAVSVPGEMKKQKVEKTGSNSAKESPESGKKAKKKGDGEEAPKKRKKTDKKAEKKVSKSED
ncbi:hypothetical protein EV356DRAFT_528021 [Viridothelium virens]|uniref:DNA-directed RNA polymerase I subunit RPA34.5 n=1 Tax=Viridothelium virens TaxID=1048519 RepID=A0A6A6HNH5_VIRVR|nr:hypothetical protein EV356DRAFT_528021 [Viridothelium virens]